VYVPKPKPEPRDFTREELRQFDGSTPGQPIYIGIKGKVYDVSPRADFYGPSGPYGCFAGRDASRALAMGSLEEKDIANHSLEGLDASELEALEEWIQSYEMKYDVVGTIVFEAVPEAAGPAAVAAAPEHTAGQGAGTEGEKVNVEKDEAEQKHGPEEGEKEAHTS